MYSQPMHISEICIVKHIKFSYNKCKGNWNLNLQMAIANKNVNLYLHGPLMIHNCQQRMNKQVPLRSFQN